MPLLCLRPTAEVLTIKEGCVYYYHLLHGRASAIILYALKFTSVAGIAVYYKWIVELKWAGCLQLLLWLRLIYFWFKHSTIIGGESWQHFVRDVLYVPETSPRRLLEGGPDGQIEITGFLYSPIVGGESWQHFVNEVLHVPKTSPEDFSVYWTKSHSINRHYRQQKRPYKKVFTKAKLFILFK